MPLALFSSWLYKSRPDHPLFHVCSISGVLWVSWNKIIQYFAQRNLLKLRLSCEHLTLQLSIATVFFPYEKVEI